MIVGIGTDICELYRFGKRANRESSIFFKRLFHECEQHHFSRLTDEIEQIRWTATVFAVKEAALKALGTGIDGRYPLNRIQFRQDEQRQVVHLPQEWLAVYQVPVYSHLTVSYSNKAVTAFVMLTTGGSMHG